MKAFRFPLERVLQWRRMQCELEEAANSRLVAQRAQLAQSLSDLTALRKGAADSILAETTVASADFQTLANFHVWTDHQRVRLQARAQQLQQEAQAQMLGTAEARRKKKLLETLRESRLVKWTALRDAEDEQAGADSWLSRFAAERYTTEHAAPPSR